MLLPKNVVVDRYLDSTRTSRKLYNRAIKVMPGGNTRGVVFFRPYPSYARRGKGSHIWDVDGNERIDYCNNYGPLILGHNHPKVLSAIKEQLDCGTVLGAPTEKEVELAEKITEWVPSAELARFTGTGTEAAMNLFRLVRVYTGRDKIAKFEGGFHGTSDPAWVSTHPTKELMGPYETPRSVPDSEGITEGIIRDIIVMPFNDTEVTEATIKKHRDEIAAVIIEPVLGAGGGLAAKTKFLKALRETTERYDILLCFDEVITGFRLAPGGGEEYFGVRPDMSILGKIIGGGLPIGAFCGLEDVMNLCNFPEAAFPNHVKPRVPSSGTYNAHPLAMAAGVATLNELKPGHYEHINRLGNEIRSGLAQLMNDTGIKGVTTGMGSLWNVYFTERKAINSYRDTLTEDIRCRRYFDLDLLNNGVYLAPAHVCSISAATTDEDLNQTLDAMEKSLNTILPTIHELSS